MEYKFDIVKRPLLMGVFVNIIMLLWMILIVFFGNLHYPAFICIMVAFLFYALRKVLFWGRMNIKIISDNNIFFINDRKFLLSDIKNYEHRSGHIFTSSAGRQVFVIHLVNGTRIKIIPCKSSELVGQYDSFLKEFTEYLKSRGISTYSLSIWKALIIIISIMTVGLTTIYIVFNLVQKTLQDEVAGVALGVLGIAAAAAGAPLISAGLALTGIAVGMVAMARVGQDGGSDGGSSDGGGCPVQG